MGHLTKLAAVFLFCPFLLFAGVNRYASPTGSATSDGSIGTPWNITRALSACSNDTTIILLDGLYLQDSTVSWNPGTGTGRSRMIAAYGTRPVFTRKNNQAPRVYPAQNTTLQGIWFGGLPINDSLGAALGHNTARILDIGDSLIQCVTFNTWDDGWGSSAKKITVKNCLFINTGISNNLPHQHHGVYFTGQGSKPDSTIQVYRSVFVASPVAQVHAGQGWSIHMFHDPHSGVIRKNFTAYNYPPVQQGQDMTARDNVFWSNGVLWDPVEDSSAVPNDSPHVWRHNLLSVTTVGEYPYQNYHGNNFQGWPDGVAERGNAAFGCVYRWDGDSTYVSEDWVELPHIYVMSFGVVKHVVQYNFGNMSSMIGTDSATVDSARFRLAAATYDQTAQQVHDNGTILSNWQTLLNVVDFWQGAAEDSAGGGGGGSGSSPTGTFSASPTSLAYGGGSSTLTWTSSGATSASIDQGIGSVATSGSQGVSLTTTTTYTLTLTNTSGSTQYTATVTVAGIETSIQKWVPWVKP